MAGGHRRATAGAPAALERTQVAQFSHEGRRDFFGTKDLAGAAAAMPPKCGGCPAPVALECATIQKPQFEQGRFAVPLEQLARTRGTGRLRTTD